jgi:hypothetical protein
MTNSQNIDFLNFAHDTCPPERVAAVTATENTTNENKLDTKKAEEAEKIGRTCEESS